MIPLVPRPSHEGSGSTAAAINDRGQVVGWTFTNQWNPQQDEARAFVWQSGKTTYLAPLPGARLSAALAINEPGQIAGWSETSEGTRHAVLWGKDRRPRDLGTLGGSSSAALSLNAHGQVVGWSETSDGERHAFLWQGAQMSDLGTGSGKGSEALAINAHGRVIGVSFAATASSGGAIAPVHAFVWDGGKMTDLGRVADSEWRIAINDRGEVAGTHEEGGRRTRAFRWANGRFDYLPIPYPATASHAYAIDQRGQIVGSYETPPTTHATLWESGKAIDLGFLGRNDGRGTGANAFDINSRGDIVGNSWHFMDTSHAVRWTH